MNYEEKYKEALERARALRQEAIDKEYAIDYVKDYEAIFPELAESEDERIRKWLIAELKDDYFTDYTPDESKAKAEKAIANLEKQKEQKSAEVDERMKNDKHFLSICQHLETLISESKNEGAEESIDKDYRWLCEFYRKSRSASVEENYKKPAEWSEEEKAIIYGCINRICVPDKYIDHSNDARSIAFLMSLLNGQRIREGCMGIKGPSCDPGRRGRMGGVPKEISKEAEAFQAQFPAPYDKDDIITAYETAKMKAIEDLPQWKKAKIIGVGECTIGAAFEATGRRYPILYCYGYGISIEQLFEKLPKEDK